MSGRVVWRKSSYSDNGADCVEVAFVPGQGLSGWRNSSHSMNQGACVEVAFNDVAVAARDSKDPEGPVLVFSRGSWAAFLAGLSE
ncbi:DUF397 domain-containing protein [Saccharopolyspora indica]|uniref:DUF397 domain-containing protein n=1 Tax=Saccharopolyspora indica TaxID=1229659 RepID=UPI0022EA9B30|nr:DUF397 domain-containing protein [Saccharopolyspora indica]MDA3643955.1 DUF397 domain-containing protein [Saccharopolyspora indica]